MRTIKAIFSIQEDSNLAGVMFKCGNKTIDWNDLTQLEQTRLLNAFVEHYNMYVQSLNKDD